MGYYVNPTGQKKEQFLADRGVARQATFKWSDTPEGSLPVVLVDNGWMTAAGIIYSEEEFKAFTDPNDSRPRKIYTVSIADLVKYANSPDFNRFIEKSSGISC